MMFVKRNIESPPLIEVHQTYKVIVVLLLINVLINDSRCSWRSLVLIIVRDRLSVASIRVLIDYF